MEKVTTVLQASETPQGVPPYLLIGVVRITLVGWKLERHEPAFGVSQSTRHNATVR